MRELLSLLDEAGKAVYILDLPGAGESDKPKRPYSLEDLDTFLEAFLQDVVRARSTVVAESILSASALRVSSKRPDLIRRTVLLSPTGINSLHQPPSEREQRLYDRLYADERGSEGFYRNLLNDSSLSYFLKFAFFDDSFVNEALLNDYRVLRDNIEQRWLTLSFVGGQLYRSFEASAQDVFIPVLALFGAEYEAFADTPPTRASEFQALRPDFEYVEIPKSGSSVQRERPELVAKEIITFSVED
jgi:pimeloyl-ACP methyl ester carboxylesterase